MSESKTNNLKLNILNENQKKEIIILNEKINKLNSKIINLESENNYLKTHLSGYKSNVIPTSVFEKSINDKDEQIEKISQKYLNLQHEFNKFKIETDKNYEKEIKSVKMAHDSISYQIENVLKIEKLNDIMYYKILDLENLIKKFQEEETERINKIKIKHDNKLSEFKKKMLDYIKQEHDQYGIDSNIQSELNYKLTLLHTQELIDDLQFSSKKIEELIKEKEELKRKMIDLKSDLKIIMGVNNALQQKNKLFAKKLHDCSSPINYNNNNNNKNNNIIKYNYSETNKNSEKNNSSNNSIKVLNSKFCSNKKLNAKQNNINFTNFNTTVNSNNYNNNASIGSSFLYLNHIRNKSSSISNSSDKKYIITKELVNKEKEKENYRMKYETANSQLKYLSNKFGNIINLYNEILEKIYNENYDIKKIYINLEDFQQCNFEKLNNEQKYAVLISLINEIVPIVSKDKLNNDVLLNRLSKTKTKFFFRNYGNFFNNTHNKFIFQNNTYNSNNEINSTTNSFSDLTIGKKGKKMIKFDKLSELSYKRKLFFKDNIISINNFKMMK